MRVHISSRNAFFAKYFACNSISREQWAFGFNMEYPLMRMQWTHVQRPGYGTRINYL